jgi:hypothetical protein
MNNEEITVIRTASCPSISGKSTIGYDIGNRGDQQFIRLSGNSSGGIFCREWLLLADVEQLLKAVPQPTAKTLRPLYVGKSANSPGFLLACAIHENLAGNIPATETTLPKSSSPKPAKKKSAQEA